MNQKCSYQIGNVSENIDHEIKRLGAQVDLFWPQELNCYREFGLMDGMSIAEFGCGPGYLLEKLLNTFPNSKVFGVEIDSLLSRFAKSYLDKKNTNRHYVIQSSILCTGLKTNTFDFAIVRLVLEHLPDPSVAMREVFRILKPNGKSVFIDNDFEMHLITYPVIPELKQLYDAYCKCRTSQGGNPKIGRQLPALMKQTGFSNIDLRLITAHNHLSGDEAFFASEGIGIPVKLVKEGFLDSKTLNKISLSWRKMLKDKHHCITRQLFLSVGQKAAPDVEASIDKVENDCCQRPKSKKKNVIASKANKSHMYSNSKNDLVLVVQDILKSLVIDVLSYVKENKDISGDGSISNLPLELSFVEIGIDSIASSDLVDAIDRSFKIELGIDVLFDCGNIKNLAQHMVMAFEKQCLSRVENDVSLIKTGHEKPDEPESSYTRSISESPITVREKAADETAVHDTHQIACAPNNSMPIAIVGLSGRFAGSDTVAELWDNLHQGRCMLTEIERDGWNAHELFDAHNILKNQSVSKYGGLIAGIERFDPFFFNISPREARVMEPRQRMFLEESFKAIEDAGYNLREISGKQIGVFAGIRSSGYCRLLFDSGIDSNALLASDMSIVPSRVSYYFNLKGPSITVDTACSSSLCAVHYASNSILSGESEAALAGGAFIMNTPLYYLMASKSNILSSSGRCKPFDNCANGFVPGEGVGVVFLKRYDRALQDGDYIYGVIKGSAINHDGRTNGIMAPSSVSQEKLLRIAYHNAGINPETISYVEANGVGSMLGDTMEIKALTSVFAPYYDNGRRCVLGSHKPNIGHCLTASGMAGLFKILMAMKNGIIPPTIGSEQINSRRDLRDSPFYVNTKCIPWETDHGIPKRAGISSFGLGGVNCHMVIEQSADVSDRNQFESAAQPHPYYLIPISAKTQTALRKKQIDLLAWLKIHTDQPLNNIAATLQVGRTHYKVRRALVIENIPELIERLDSIIKGLVSPESRAAKEDTESRIEKQRQKKRLENILSDLSNGEMLTFEHFRAKLMSLADFYTRGFDIDWTRLYKKSWFKRVPLPVYPFSDAKTFPLITSTSHGTKNSASQINRIIQKESEKCLTQCLSFRKALDELETFGRQSIKNVVVNMAGCQPVGAWIGRNTLKEKMSIDSRYDRLFDSLIAMLARAKLIRVKGNRINLTTSDQVAMENLKKKRFQLVEEFPQIKSHMEFLWPCLEHFEDILKGKILPTDIMFPDSSMRLVEKIYRGNPTADLFNNLLASGKDLQGQSHR